MVIVPSSRAQLQTALFFIANHLYINNDETNVDYNQMCERSAIKLLKSTAKTVGILMSSVVISATFPIILTVSRHQIQLVVPVLVPFTDLNTWHGLCINLFNQLITIFFGICAGLGIEIIICMLKNSFWTMSAAVCNSLDELIDLFMNRMQRQIEESRATSRMWFCSCVIVIGMHWRWMIYAIGNFSYNH